MTEKSRTHDRSKVTFDADEAADMLKVHRNTVLELAESGELPGTKVGRAWVFLVDDLIEWLRKQIAADIKKRRGAEGTEVPKRRGGGRRRELPELPELPRAS